MQTRYYLEMLEKPNNIVAENEISFELINPPDGKVNAEMYRRVGAPWNWKDRLKWSNDRWQSYADYPVLETRLGYYNGELAGYCELDIQPKGNCQLVYFGLLPEFCSKGIGKQMLNAIIAIAWSKPSTNRLWLNTCSSDHPSALNNYIKRGFNQYRCATY